MIKTINFELSKRLTEWGYLDNIETEYEMNDYWKIVIWESDYKTLTLEEAIEVLPNNFSLDNYWYHLQMGKKYIWYFKNVTYCLNSKNPIQEFTWNTLLEAIEKMLEYLLDNNLLTK